MKNLQNFNPIVVVKGQYKHIKKNDEDLINIKKRKVEASAHISQMFIEMINERNNK